MIEVCAVVCACTKVDQVLDLVDSLTASTTC